MRQERGHPTMEAKSNGVGEENLGDAYPSTVQRLGAVPMGLPEGWSVLMERRVRRLWP